MDTTNTEFNESIARVVESNESVARITGSNNPPTVEYIAFLAKMMRVQFAEGETTFDLDHTNPTLQGTYRKTQAGIEAAYGDLMRFRLLMRDVQLGGPIIEHLARECHQIPQDIASLLKALTAYFTDQSDPTGSVVSDLRGKAARLQRSFGHIDDLLSIIEKQNKGQQ